MSEKTNSPSVATDLLVTPDVAVVYHIAFDTQKSLTAWSTGAGPYGWRWGGGFSTTDVRVNEIVVGTLVVDVADVKKNEVVWRGIGVKEIDTNAKAEKRERNIREAVQKFLAITRQRNRQGRSERMSAYLRCRCEVDRFQSSIFRPGTR